ncbi:FAD-binding oxidoreductase [Cryptosporangium japonicum]|uniref:FAD dependent oxidoreductase domain-containing protein n=1 Tax=Cryptosporangium japonicum TaxID=80872 RepID=A0ABN0UC36_9ACTN
MRIGVIGAGIVGLSTAYALRRYPVTVRVFDRAAPMTGRSRGGTRIFRYAHDTPALVRYAARAREGWNRWERTSGQVLIGAETTVVSGDGAAERYAAMRAAGVRCGLYPSLASVPGLPARPETPGPFLVDPAGGVIQAARTGAFLAAAVRRGLVVDEVERVTAHGHAATIHSSRGSWQCDSVLVAAGAGPLVPEVVADPEHHFRFTFPLAPGADPRCWIERSGSWRDGFTTYGHRAGAGLWALGAHLPAEDTAWSLPVAEARRRALSAVTAYVREFLSDVVSPEPVDEVYCAPTRGLGDGIHVARSGPVLSVWGENLFKFAPALGADLAAAVASRGLPEDLP